ncbi:MAG: hypothetical protein WC356_05060 [Candidatus Micrarchaeia archaeon]|jgi:hypothetical protein
MTIREKDTRIKTYDETLPIGDDEILVHVKITFPEGGGPAMESAIIKVKQHMRKAVTGLAHLDQAEMPLGKSGGGK